MYNLAIRKVYISTPPSPEVENFQIKIFVLIGCRTPDLLNQRQACYCLSQCDGHMLHVCKTRSFSLLKEEFGSWKIHIKITQTNMEGGQSGTYLRLTRVSSGPRVSVTKTYRDETKMNISARSQWPSSAVEYKVFRIHDIKFTEILISSFQEWNANF